MLLARGFSYADAHRARLGVNYKQIPVNSPQGTEAHPYTVAGAMRVVNAPDPVYAPNTKGGPADDGDDPAAVVVLRRRDPAGRRTWRTPRTPTRARPAR